MEPHTPPDPDGIAAKLSLAVALHEGGQLQQAAALYLDIIEADPAHFDALHLLGVYALQIGDLEAAYELVMQALSIDPNSSQAYMHLSAVREKQGLPDAALIASRQALDLDPDNIIALSNCGGLLSSQLKRPAEALPLLQRALRLAPGHADALNNMGHALIELRRCDEALEFLDRAIQIQPDYALAHYNKGNALLLMNHADEAMRSYDAALAIAPGLADAQFSQSLCRLLTGDWQRGWPQYESRWRMPAYQHLLQHYAQPLWLGGIPLQGKTILVHFEQGFGDTLHMCRYVPLLAAQGARVVLRVQAPLKKLLANLHGAAQVLDQHDALPEVDLHIPLMSLPLAFDTRPDSVPGGVPYLHAGSEGLQLDVNGQRRVGLAWAGSTAHHNDRSRSIPLAQFRRLMAPGIRYISLQRDFRLGDEAHLDGEPTIRRYPEALDDFADTAALIAQLDLVICVDTAVAHLAGAMGKPVWLLLPFAPDWRWGLDGETSSWYPHMRLFRQERAGDWEEVLERVQQALIAG